MAAVDVARIRLDTTDGRALLEARESARQNYVWAFPGETVDKVTHEMLARDAESVVVVEADGVSKPIGIARAADILRLRRWVLEEEGHGPHRSVRKTKL